MKTELAIVGGGASAALLAWALAKAGIAREARCFSSAAIVGPGVAYSTSLPTHLLNVRAAKLSIDPDTPLDFASWAGLSEHAFAPRGTYGAYLAARADGLVERVRADVIDLDRRRGTWRLHLSNGTIVEARSVVLAIGLDPPAFRNVHVSRRFVREPWSPIPPVEPSTPVVLLGTGLTAIDVVLSLEAAGHRGPVVAVSRHGLLPRAHRESPAPPIALSLPTAPTLRELVRVLRREVLVSGDWQAVVDAMRPHTSAFWQSFGPPDRDRFLRHVRRIWDVHRHRLAPEIAERVEEWRLSRRLEVVAARVREVHEEPDGLVVETTRGAIRAGLVVDCTGPSLDPRTSNGLRKRLLDRRIATVHPTGLGLCATRDGELEDPRGHVATRLFAMGALLVGERWECTAIPELRAHAAELARILSFRP